MTETPDADRLRHWRETPPSFPTGQPARPRPFSERNLRPHSYAGLPGFRPADEAAMRARWAERLDEDDIDDVPVLDLPTLPDLRPYAWGALAALTVVLIVRKARS